MEQITQIFPDSSHQPDRAKKIPAVQARKIKISNLGWVPRNAVLPQFSTWNIQVGIMAPA